MSARAVARTESGAEVDITEGVQALYDLVISSMDWGSGFWSFEDAVPVAIVARAMGFPKVAEVEKYLLARQREENRWPSTEQRPVPVPGHDHLYSAKGRCMWPKCSAEIVAEVTE